MTRKLLYDSRAIYFEARADSRGFRAWPIVVPRASLREKEMRAADRDSAEAACLFASMSLIKRVNNVVDRTELRAIDVVG